MAQTLTKAEASSESHFQAIFQAASNGHHEMTNLLLEHVLFLRLRRSVYALTFQLPTCRNLAIIVILEVGDFP